MTELVESAPLGNIWGVVWKLLNLRFLILTTSFRRSTPRRKIGMAFVGLLILGFLVFVFYLSLMLLRFLRSAELAALSGSTSLILDSIPALIMSGAFIGILFTSFGVLLQAMYLSGDMDFLLSTPIPMRAVFVAKMLQAILPNFALVCLFGLPVLFGLGRSSGYSLLYYPMVILILSALALAAAGISSLFVMGVVRIFPARRVAEILGFIGGLLSILCSQTGQFASWSNISQTQTQQATQILSKVNNPWSPLAWAGLGLRWIGEARWIEGLAVSGAVLIVCGFIFGGALVSAEKLYYSGWASLQNKHKKVKTVKKNYSLSIPKVRNDFIPWHISSAVIQIVRKDLIILRRDIRNMSQLITPLIVGMVYFVMLLRGGSDLIDGAGRAPVWTGPLFKSIQTYSSIGLSLFVGWMLVSRLAGMSFSQEGKNYWLLKTAPVSAYQLISSKFLVAFLPVTGLCWLFLLITAVIQRPNLATLVFALPVIAITVAGNTGIHLSFGIIGANMHWEDPRQMQRGASGCLGSLVSMAYLAVSLLLFFGPAVLMIALGYSETAGMIVGLVMGSIFCLACMIVPLRVVKRRVDRLGE